MVRKIEYKLKMKTAAANDGECWKKKYETSGKREAKSMIILVGNKWNEKSMLMTIMNKMKWM